MIIFVRHPPTTLNDSGKVRAQLDPPLAPEAQAIMQATARQFKGVQVDRIYTDDTKRTRAMAAVIAKVTGATVIVTPGLKTWDLGSFAGKDIKTVAPDLKRYMLKDYSKAPPGGESFETFVRRFVQFMRPFYRKSESIVMVTHGRPIMTAKAWQAADADKDPMGLADIDLSPEPTLVGPGGVAIMGSDQPFKVIC